MAIVIYVSFMIFVVSSVKGLEKTAFCFDDAAISFACSGARYEYVTLRSIGGESNCPRVGSCTDAEEAGGWQTAVTKCSRSSSCNIKRSDLYTTECAASIKYDCVVGERTTGQIKETTPQAEDDWKTDYGSYQWVIIYIVIAVVLVALIILIVMLINRCCFKAFNQEKPKFVSAAPTESVMGSTLNSRSVSMSTLARNTTPRKKEATAEEIDEVRAIFGTNKKEKKEKSKDKFLGQKGLEVSSRRSSGDGESSTLSRFYHGDDGSSGIGLGNDTGHRNTLYDDADTCHDDYEAYTMKKSAKSPLVNPNFNTLQANKKVDTDLYKKDAPSVDIIEDKREEDFRLDINNWGMNVNIGDGQESAKSTGENESQSSS